MNMTAWNTLLKITELGINMNAEKLDVLVSQAGFDVERLRAPHLGGFPREDMLALESLVELVVRECRDIVGKTRDRAIEDSWNVDEAMSTAMFDIEESFGV